LSNLANKIYRMIAARDALPQASLGCDNALEPAAPHGSCGGYFSIRAAAFEPRIKHCGRIR